MGARATMPPGLVQSTLPDPNAETADDQAGAENGQSRGVLRAPRPRRKRRGKEHGEKMTGRKLTLRDSVFERLQLAAIKRRSNPSDVADGILDKNLPKLKITSEE
jgi:hypothetical protein